MIAHKHKTGLTLLTEAHSKELDPDKRAELQWWAFLIVDLALQGEGGTTSTPLATSTLASGSPALNPVKCFVKQLRSGKPIPGPVAQALADLFEDEYEDKYNPCNYKFERVVKKKKLKKYKYDTNVIDTYVLVNKIKRDGVLENKRNCYGVLVNNPERDGINITEAVCTLAEILCVDEKTIWNRLEKFRDTYSPLSETDTIALEIAALFRLEQALSRKATGKRLTAI